MVMSAILSDIQARVSQAMPRLLADLETLGGVGRDGPYGITRIMYDPAFQQAAMWLRARMESAGMAARVDAAGNIIGRLDPPQAERPCPAVIIGGHIDTVPGGGAYDGALGVLAGIAVAEALGPDAGRWTRALEVIAFADGEGGYVPMMGSRAMTGQLDPEILAGARSWEGRALTDAMADVALSVDELPAARRANSDSAAYLELHIEQGLQLQAAGVPIGIVDGVVGREQVDLVFSGERGHSGTVAMGSRRDALRAAASLVTLAPDAILGEEATPSARLTYGQLTVSPGVSTVIPDQAVLRQEVRAMDNTEIDRISEQAWRMAQICAADLGCTVRRRAIHRQPPTPLDPILQADAAKLADQLDLSHLPMRSGAGHDAQSFADRCPTALLFIPCEGGRSHRPDEACAPADIAAGTTLLAALAQGLLTG